MPHWTFFSNHMHVLTLLARRPDVRMRDIAAEVGITERAANRIVSELVEAGYVTRTRRGTRNRYEVRSDGLLRHPLHEELRLSDVLELLGGHGGSGPGMDAERAVAASAFAAAPTPLAVTDEQGIVMAANRSFSRIVGIGEKDLAGSPLSRLAHPDEPIADGEWLERVRAAETIEEIPHTRLVRGDGEVVWVSFRVSAMPASHGRGNRLIVQVEDLAHQRRHDRALAEAEERFRSAFENAPIGMALVAPDGRWLKVNRSVCDITGYPETALLTGTFQNITHPEDLDADLAYVHEMLAGRRRTYQMQKRYLHADGHVIWVTLSVSLVRDAAGEPLYFISQIEDITERKRREHALRHRDFVAARLT